MLAVRNRMVFTVVAVLVAGLAFGWFDDDGGATKTRGGGRWVTVSIAWEPQAHLKPGHVDIAGQIGGAHVIGHESTSINPFAESDLVYPGERVEIQGWAVDGPFLAINCGIVGLPPGSVEKSSWPGLRARCFAVVPA